jgi:hypothetical protein
MNVKIMVKVKVKLSLYFNWAQRHEGFLGEWRYSSMHTLTSALDGGEWSASRPGRFTPRERAPVKIMKGDKWDNTSEGLVYSVEYVHLFVLPCVNLI